MKKRNLVAQILVTASLLAGGVAGVISPDIAFAAAPMARTAGPGFYRVMLGDFEVTAITDGTIEIPVDKVLTNTTAAKTDKELGAAFEAKPYQMNVNAYLINTGSKLILIDAGSGPYYGPYAGRLLARLKASGYQPEQVDEIYITHLHPDHVGGVTADGKRVFPNAVVRVDKRDADFWLSKANLEKASPDQRDLFSDAVASLAPYVQAGRLKTFDGAADLAPGIRALSLFGHTPGHTGYVVESKGQKMLVWGDIMHVAAVQFPNPQVTITFDTDSKVAEKAREAMYADAAEHGYLIAAAHVSFPGLGHVRKVGNGYEWIPVSYAEFH